jgi:hypothetical protein
MQHPALAQIEGYWEGLRRGRPVPLRAEVDPRGIDLALEYAFILERIAPGVARFRLAGMHLNDLMGMEVRGMPLTAFFNPEARRQVTDALEHLFEEPAKIRFHMTAETSGGRPELAGSLILLPLKSDLGDISRALGCLVTEGAAGRTPRRFGLERVDVKPLLESAMQEEKPPVARPTPEPAGLAEDPARFNHADGSATPDAAKAEPSGQDERRPLSAERAYLKLVHTKT